MAGRLLGVGRPFSFEYSSVRQDLRQNRLPRYHHWLRLIIILRLHHLALLTLPLILPKPDFGRSRRFYPFARMPRPIAQSWTASL